MKKEQQLELNLKGISNQKELDENMKEVSDHANYRLEGLLSKIIKNKKYTKNELHRLISLAKWTNGEKSKDSFLGKYNKD